MDEAMKKLPRPVIQSLLCQSSEEFDEQNPLHIAAENENHKMVKIILDFYRSSASSSEAQSTTETTGEKPWLGLDVKKRTPLHLALERCNERIALEILSMDVESLSGMEDWADRGPVFMAMENWLYRVALQILTSAPNCSLRRAG
uniref:Uncharacterized protein n=1 Tax=Opuntia streptacantha TaxID=393608 RepID=A0A7C8ZX36_OPUST